MIAAHHFASDFIIDDLIHKVVRHDIVVQPPSDIAGSGISHVGPKCVGTFFVRIKFPETVDETFSQEIGETLTFFIREASILPVRFGVFEINFVMSDIQIACENDAFLLFQTDEVFPETRRE